MERTETQQKLFEIKTGKEAKAMSVVDAYSPEEAMLVAQKMFARECAGWGDEERALTKVARRCGMSAISFKRLMKGQRKGVDLRLSRRVRGAYLSLCHSLIAQLQNDIRAIEEVHGHAAVADFITDVERLEAQVEAAKEANTGSDQSRKGR